MLEYLDCIFSVSKSLDVSDESRLSIISIPRVVFLGSKVSPPKFLKALADATGFFNIIPIFPTNSPTALGIEDNAA